MGAVATSAVELNVKHRSPRESRRQDCSFNSSFFSTSYITRLTRFMRHAPHHGRSENLTGRFPRRQCVSSTLGLYCGSSSRADSSGDNLTTGRKLSVTASGCTGSASTWRTRFNRARRHTHVNVGIVACFTIRCA